MKIALSTTEKDNLEANIDPRFGRCDYFILVDSDDMSFESFENESANAVGGAGIGAAQFVINKGAEVVITGNCGPKAFTTLQAGGIKVIVDVNGQIRKAVEDFSSGKLSEPITRANVDEHAGMGMKNTNRNRHGQNCGQGKGTGQGKGQCKGKGMGRGMGRGRV